MLIHEVKHANVKHFANSRLQFIVPILEILLLIQLHGWNNLADCKPESVWVEKLRMPLSKHGTVCHYLDWTALPYLHMFRVFHKNWGRNCLLVVLVPDIENVLCILTLKQV